MRSVSRQGYLKGAAILSAAVIATKAIGFFYKVPLQNLIGDENTGIFTAAYNVYSVLLAVAAAGIPVALSRLVASAAEQERPVQVRRYFLVAMPVFTFLGGLGAALMYLFSRQIAGFVGVPEAAAGIRVLAPAVLLVCVYSVYRGYLQGFGNMIPTALSQIVESVGKVAVGLTAAWLLLDRGAPGERVCAGALAGTTARWLEPKKRRITCGAIRSTKPITPTIETAVPVSSAARPISIIFTRLRSTPADRACSSPKVFLASSQPASRDLKPACARSLSSLLASTAAAEKNGALFQRDCGKKQKPPICVNGAGPRAGKLPPM